MCVCVLYAMHYNMRICVCARVYVCDWGEVTESKFWGDLAMRNAENGWELLIESINNWDLSWF